jgi:hypothetical protein
MGIESDPNFTELSDRDRQLHLWAMAQTRNQTALQSNGQIVPECTAEADAMPRNAVTRSINEYRSPVYVQLQAELLSLSQNSKQIIAENSGHFIILSPGHKDSRCGYLLLAVRLVRQLCFEIEFAWRIHGHSICDKARRAEARRKTGQVAEPAGWSKSGSEGAGEFGESGLRKCKEALSVCRSESKNVESCQEAMGKDQSAREESSRLRAKNLGTVKSLVFEE